MAPSPSEIGRCALILDEDEEEVCNHPGAEEVLVRNRFGLFAVALCARHKQDHKTYYEENPSRSRRRREARSPRASQSRGRVNSVNGAVDSEEELRHLPGKAYAS